MNGLGLELAGILNSIDLGCFDSYKIAHSESEHHSLDDILRPTLIKPRVGHPESTDSERKLGHPPASPTLSIFTEISSRFWV